MAPVDLEQSEAIIGSVSSVLLWNGDYLIADRYPGNKKLYTTAGELIRVIGRAGDGPGEFRHPLRLAGTSDGGFVAVDMPSGSISLFDGEGEFVERSILQIRQIGALEGSPSGEGLCCGGFITGSGKDGWAPQIVHMVGTDGHPRQPFASLPLSTTPRERFNATVHWDITGNTLFAAKATHPRLVLYDLSTGVERVISARTPLCVEHRMRCPPRTWDGGQARLARAG